MIALGPPRSLLCLCAALCLLCGAAAAQQPTFTANDLLGTYTSGHTFGGSSITIEAEGRYHSDGADCTQRYYEAGTYTFKGGVLSFVATKRTVRGHGDDEPAQNLLDPKVYKERYHEDLPAAPPKDELVPVKWGARLYLMRQESLREFCNAINFGLEPRAALSSMWYLDTFYLRNGDEAKMPTGRPALAAELLAFLLRKPVEAEITYIEQDDKAQVATINKGSEAGLKPGMRLVANKQEPSLWGGLEVLSVGYGYAKAQLLGEAQVGDKVSSKFTPPGYE